MSETSPLGSVRILPLPLNEHHTQVAAALALAERGIPVFPCKPDKSPYFAEETLEHGHKCATTDPQQVRAWLNVWPDAKIGMPTGVRSGVWVLDVDRRPALDELGSLPATYTVTTPKGGSHLYFVHVEGVTNRSGSLPDGIDVRGEGGHVIVPPSPGYTVANWRHVAYAPLWLLERVTETGLRVLEGSTQRSRPAAHNFVLPKRIPYFSRNNTVYAYGCCLRGRGWEHEPILQELLRVNAERCAPPLSDSEVRKIARSTTRYPPGSAQVATPEVLAALDAIEEVVQRHPWKGRGGGSRRDVMIVLIQVARLHGTLIPAGVRVSLDNRSLALEAAMSTSAANGAAHRLREERWLRFDNADRKPKDAGAFVLLPREVEHSTTFPTSVGRRGTARDAERTSVSVRAPRLRSQGPLGKRCGMVVDFLVQVGGEATESAIAVGVGVGRVRDLRRRELERLVVAGVVGLSGGRVRLLPGWSDALEKAREEGGEKRMERVQRKMNEWQREGYRRWLEERDVCCE